jgi:hypothetical protein
VRRLVVPVLAAGLTLLAGCADGGSAPAAGSAPAPTVSRSATASAWPTDPACPPAQPATFRWPEPVPADLPVPPSAVLGEVTEQPGGPTLVRFSTNQSIRDGVLFVVKELPRAGYTLARGDAEASEADAPFVKGRTRGVLRILATGQCQTDWILALATGDPGAGNGGRPLLPPAPDASPLPFG